MIHSRDSPHLEDPARVPKSNQFHACRVTRDYNWLLVCWIQVVLAGFLEYRDIFA